VKAARLLGAENKRVGKATSHQPNAEYARLSLGFSIASIIVESAVDLFAMDAHRQEDTLMKVPRELLFEFVMLVFEMQDSRFRNQENRPGDWCVL